MTDKALSNVSLDDLVRRALEIIAAEAKLAKQAAETKRAREAVKLQYDQAALVGFNKKILKKIVREMMAGPDDVQMEMDFQSEANTYRRAVGLIDDHDQPIERAAFDSEMAAQFRGAGWQVTLEGVWWRTDAAGNREEIRIGEAA